MNFYVKLLTVMNIIYFKKDFEWRMPNYTVNQLIKLLEQTCEMLIWDDVCGVRSTPWVSGVGTLLTG